MKWSHVYSLRTKRKDEREDKNGTEIENDNSPRRLRKSKVYIFFVKSVSSYLVDENALGGHSRLKGSVSCIKD